jgi:protein-disulfide isomerase
MKTDRVIVVLLTLMVGLQAATMIWQRPQAPSEMPGRQGQQQRRAPVTKAPEGAVMDLAGLPIRGDDRAKVVLLEFSDYQCPFCSRHAEGPGREVDEQFVQTGKIRHVFANNPLPIHKEAKLLATAAICAGDQGRFWEMHDGLFEAKPNSSSGVLTIANDMKLDSKQFSQCLADTKGANARITKEMGKAKEFNLTGTPAFAIGRIEANSTTIKIETLVLGAQPFGVFEKAINDALAAKS